MVGSRLKRKPTCQLYFMLTVIVALPTSTNQIKPIQLTLTHLAWLPCAQVNSITRFAAGAPIVVLVEDGRWLIDGLYRRLR